MDSGNRHNEDAATPRLKILSFLRNYLEMAFEPCSLGVALAFPAALIVVAMSPPDARDITAVLGALPATWIVMVEARKKDRSIGHTTCVFLGSMAFGCILPGAIVYKYFPDKVETMSWHFWAGMGFFWALMGWAIVLGLVKLATAEGEGFVRKFARKWIGEDKKEKE